MDSLTGLHCSPSWFPTGLSPIGRSRCFCLPRRRHQKRHYRTLVSRGMPLNNHIKPGEAMNMSHFDKHPRRDKNGKSLLTERKPAGRKGGGSQQAHMYIVTLQGCVPRLSFNNWFSDCFQWLMSIRDFKQKNALRSDPVGGGGGRGGSGET